jgi:NADPH2:quinone reductase
VNDPRVKVIRVATPGGPTVMSIEEIDRPSPGPGQALIRVHAAGVNFIDIYQRSGQYPMPAPGLGLEGAGEVEAVGDGVALAIGARVAWAGVPGSYATHVIAPARSLVEVPARIDLETAAAAMLQGMTAHYLTQTTYRLAEHDRCLVHAAAGGVGLLVCQMGRRAGAQVIGTTSTADKAQRAREAGARDVILYTEQAVAPEVRRLTGGLGVDVVYDSVGKTTFAGSLDSLSPRGMLVLFGQASGPVPPFDPQILNHKGSLFLTRPKLADYTTTREELVSRASDVLEWIADGELVVTIDRRLPLSQAAHAHRLLEARQTTGKLVLVPNA